MWPRPQFVISGLLAEFELADLCREAQLIVRCRVTDAAFRSSVAGITLAPPGKEPTSLLVVYTDHRVKIEEALKNPALVPSGSELIVRTLGGETPTLSGYANGEAQISPNEHLVLFLSRDHVHPAIYNHKIFPEAPFTFTVFGGFQGKFNILDRETNFSVVKRLEQPESAFIELNTFRQQILDSLPGPARAQAR